MRISTSSSSTQYTSNSKQTFYCSLQKLSMLADVSDSHHGSCVWALSKDVILLREISRMNQSSQSFTRALFVIVIQYMRYCDCTMLRIVISICDASDSSTIENIGYRI